MGRYIISPKIFECIEQTGAGAGGEIQLTDALKQLCSLEDVYAYDFIGRRYDVGNRMGFLEATVEFALARDDLKRRVHTVPENDYKINENRLGFM